MTARKRVAIVDDDRDMVQTLREILEMHGWETLCSHDGEGAVALSERDDVSLYLMDVRMPRKSGIDAWQAIRKRRPGALSILMTAYAPPEALVLTSGQGVCEVLRKPVSVPDLLAALEAARREAQ